MLDTLNFWLATGFGLGLAPVAPGTFGSLIGLPLAWWLSRRATRGRALVEQGLLERRPRPLRRRSSRSPRRHRR
mgnify:CR=1 FL=1